MMIIVNASLVTVGVLASLGAVLSFILIGNNVVDGNPGKVRFWLVLLFVNAGILTAAFSLLAQLTGGK